MVGVGVEVGRLRMRENDVAMTTAFDLQLAVVLTSHQLAVLMLWYMLMNQQSELQAALCLLGPAVMVLSSPVLTM